MTKRWDLAVVGAGTAGIPCAVEAAALGARVLLLEKEPVVGGTLHISGGHLSAGGTRRQRRLGVEDSPDAHFAELRRIARGSGRADLMRLAADLAPATVDWLEEQGFDFDPRSPRIVYGHEPYSVPRTYYGREGGRSILAVLERLLAGSRVEVRTGIAVERLLLEEGRVAGVAWAGGEARASAVVLASGGYGSNAALFAELDGRPLFTAAMPGSTGDGLRMARAAGAAVQGRGTFIPTFGGLPDPGDAGRVCWEDRPLLVAAERPPWEIYVDRSGHRFVAEDEPSIDKKERRLAALADLTFWTVFDSRALEESAPMVAGWSREELSARANRRPGVASGGSLAELAAHSGIDASGLAETVAEYNHGVAAGADRLGRRFLPAPLERPPFYSLRNHGTTLVTFCGVDVDGWLRVRRPDGSVIDGLYAAGEIIGAGATSGNAFCGGMLATPALAFGRQLGMAFGRAAQNV